MDIPMNGLNCRGKNIFHNFGKTRGNQKKVTFKLPWCYPRVIEKLHASRRGVYEVKNGSVKDQRVVP